jgi:hypothetical protein
MLLQLGHTGISIFFDRLDTIFQGITIRLQLGHTGISIFLDRLDAFFQGITIRLHVAEEVRGLLDVIFQGITIPRHDKTVCNFCGVESTLVFEFFHVFLQIRKPVILQLPDRIISGALLKLFFQLVDFLLVGFDGLSQTRIVFHQGIGLHAHRDVRFLGQRRPTSREEILGLLVVPVDFQAFQHHFVGFSGDADASLAIRIPDVSLST